MHAHIGFETQTNDVIYPLCSCLHCMAVAQADQSPGSAHREALQSVLQAAVERIVLTQSNGSQMQRVLAEFLGQLVAQVESAAAGVSAANAVAANQDTQS